MRWWLVVVVIAASAAPALARPAVWTLKLEGGTEYDTNIHRLEIPEDEPREVDEAPVMRSGARFASSWRHADDRRVVLTGFGGAKLFLSEDGQNENVVVAAGDARYEWALPSRQSVVGVRASYYEAFDYQPLSDLPPAGRNFATYAGEAFLTLSGPGAHRITGYAGYRDFEYKPQPDFDWDGDHYGLRYRTSSWRGDPDSDPDAAPVEMVVDYHLERRNYAGLAYTDTCGEEGDDDPRCFVPTDLSRVDMQHSVSAEVVYTGQRIYSGRYELEVNDSNSHGQAWVRQRLELGLTAELGWQLYATIKATVQLNTFLDPLLLAPDVQAQSFITIEDENRNSLIAHLARDVAERWTAEARYALYTNEFATQALSFRRQTVYLGLVYHYGSE